MVPTFITVSVISAAFGMAWGWWLRGIWCKRAQKQKISETHQQLSTLLQEIYFSDDPK